MSNLGNSRHLNFDYIYEHIIAVRVILQKCLFFFALIISLCLCFLLAPSI